LDNKKIISITQERLRFETSENKVFFVDFNKCRIGFSKFLQKENDLTEEERLELEQRTKCVALRDAFAEPMYIEFFSDPPVRFIFNMRIFKEPYREFIRLDNTIIETGWKKFDMG
jgi:hypothetical protein